MDSFRHLEPFHENMNRYRGDIERLIYAGEIACHNKGDDPELCGNCTWGSGDGMNCDLKIIRHLLGVTVTQHDPTQTTLQTPLMDQVQPVQWGRSS